MFKFKDRKNQIQHSFTTTFEMYTFSSSNQRPESQVPIYQDYCSQGTMSQLERVMFLQDKQLVFPCMGLLPMLIENKTYFNVNTRYVPYARKNKPLPIASLSRL